VRKAGATLCGLSPVAPIAWQEAQFFSSSSSPCLGSSAAAGRPTAASISTASAMARKRLMLPGAAARHAEMRTAKAHVAEVLAAEVLGAKVLGAEAPAAEPARGNRPPAFDRPLPP